MPQIAILLCTFNASNFLVEQLDSICRQSHKDWIISVSDDGSTDETRTILERYRNIIGCSRFIYFDGPRQGFARNFLSNLSSCPRSDFYAFCDQDDVWDPDKLERALEKLNGFESSRPLLYCGRTRLIDVTGAEIGLSPLFNKKPSFKNALVQSLAGGNTMVLNDAARDLIVQLPTSQKVISHDWTVYQLLTAVGGVVVYDPVPKISYRQHGGNLIGSNLGLIAKLRRIIMLLKGDFSKFSSVNEDLLFVMSNLFTDNNKKTLYYYSGMRRSYFIKRIFILLRIGLYRQTLFGNIGLFLAVCLKKI